MEVKMAFGLSEHVRRDAGRGKYIESCDGKGIGTGRATERRLQRAPFYTSTAKHGYIRLQQQIINAPCGKLAQPAETIQVERGFRVV